MKLATGLGLLAAVVIVGCGGTSAGGGSGGTGTGGSGGGAEAGGSSSGGASGGVAVGTGGDSVAEGPSCEPQQTQACDGTWAVVNSACRPPGYMTWEVPLPNCTIHGFSTYSECLEACFPDSPCLIAAYTGFLGSCDPEIQTESCWGDFYCSCTCGGDGGWHCAC